MTFRLRHLMAGLLTMVMLLAFVPAAQAQMQLPKSDPAAGEDKGDKSDGTTQRRRRRRRRRAAQPAPEPQCMVGKEITADTDNHCCWKGQAWNGLQCVGTPTSCPEGTISDELLAACVEPGCEPGKSPVGDGHCCWQMQAWSSAQERCVGNPVCPEGYAIVGETCDPDTDGDGVLALDDLCPDLAEDFDEIDDDDGCPEPDNDGDGICDPGIATGPMAMMVKVCHGTDACPMVAAPGQEDGCPAPEPEIIEPEVIEPEVVNVVADEHLIALPPPAAPEDDVVGTIGWVLIGSGVAFAGTGAVLHVLAANDADQVHRALDQPRGEPVTDLTRERAIALDKRSSLLEGLAWGGYGVGAATTAVGALLLVLTTDEAVTTGAQAYLSPLGEVGVVWRY